MNNRIAIIIFLSSLMLTGCICHSKKCQQAEFEKVENCRKAWVYLNLKEMTSIKVLHFQKSTNVCMQFFPNFIIGVNADSDTIGIVELGYKGTLRKNEIISVIPSEIDDIQQSLNMPVLFTFKKPKDNNLLCAINKIYYGVIEQK